MIEKSLRADQILTKRLGSPGSVVTDRAVSRSTPLPVTVDTIAHSQVANLFHVILFRNITMALSAVEPEVDVYGVHEMDMVRHLMDPGPVHRLSLIEVSHQSLNLFVPRRLNGNMAVHAEFQRRHSRV
jgi:hypothetical protein